MQLYNDLIRNFCVLSMQLNPVFSHNMLRLVARCFSAGIRLFPRDFRTYFPIRSSLDRGVTAHYKNNQMDVILRLQSPMHRSDEL